MKIFVGSKGTMCSFNCSVVEGRSLQFFFLRCFDWHFILAVSQMGAQHEIFFAHFKPCYNVKMADDSGGLVMCLLSGKLHDPISERASTFVRSRTSQLHFVHVPLVVSSDQD